MIELLLPLTFIALVIGVPLVILRPVSRLARKSRRRFRIALIDLFAFVVLLQIPLAAAAAVIRSEQIVGFGKTAIGIWAFVPSGALWLCGVGILSSLKIESSRTRFVFLVYALPVATAGWIALLVGLGLSLGGRLDYRFGPVQIVTCVGIVAMTHVTIYIRQLAKRYQHPVDNADGR